MPSKEAAIRPHRLLTARLRRGWSTTILARFVAFSCFIVAEMMNLRFHYGSELWFLSIHVSFSIGRGFCLVKECLHEDTCRRWRCCSVSDAKLKALRNVEEGSKILPLALELQFVQI
ncbi:hypothetical protein K1719_027913 [Acacia pycnantha]|nr:hypothetical protein K1719_027913 [Acacia pycnantha]